MEVFIIGGKHKSNARNLESEYRWEQAKILKLDTTNFDIEEVVNYRTPEGLCPPDASVIFKSCSIRGHRLYTCTSTEVLVYDIRDFRLVEHITHKYFNDLHHVVPDEHGNVYVVSTGLDAVFLVDRLGTLLKAWSVIDQCIWDRFDPEIDYRIVLSTKPHGSHPNHITVYKQQLLVTRFNQKDIIDLNDHRRRLKIEVEKPHDGAIFLDRMYITTVDGHVVIADPERLRIVRVIDLNKLNHSPYSLGWCRGILAVNECEIIVGFTRIRPTKFKTNLSWLRQNFHSLKSLPTRVASFNTEEMKVNWEVNLERHNFNGIFSIVRKC